MGAIPNKVNSFLTRRAFVRLVGEGALVVALGGLLRFMEPKDKFIRPLDQDFRSF
jgi:hypothetical protein